MEDAGAGLPAALVGGDDRIDAGAGDDVLWGGGSTAASYELGLAFAGGADSFVFARHAGQDVIEDFRSLDGDRIDLRALALDWSDLDSNGNGVLDRGDAVVTGEAGTLIDLGRAVGDAAGHDVLSVAGAGGLTAADFLLA